MFFSVPVNSCAIAGHAESATANAAPAISVRFMEKILPVIRRQPVSAGSKTGVLPHLMI
jgi:hypothetical protein